MIQYSDDLAKWRKRASQIAGLPPVVGTVAVVGVARCVDVSAGEIDWLWQEGYFRIVTAAEVLGPF